MKKTILSITLSLLAALLCLGLTGCGDKEMPDDSPRTEQRSDKGRTRVTKIDPFEHIEFYLIGSNGEATVSEMARSVMAWNGGYEFATMRVELPENNGSLKNGDLVHVTFAYGYNEEALEAANVRFTRTEADVPIWGLNGDPNYKPGKTSVVDLKDYVSIVQVHYDDLQVTVDYQKMLLDHWKDLRMDVATEDLFGRQNSLQAASFVLEGFTPFDIISEEHESRPHGSYSDIFGVGNGETVKLVWVPVEDDLAWLQRLLNVEFRNTEVFYTVDPWVETPGWGPLPGTEIDLFEELELEYEGTNGNGYLTGYCMIDTHSYYVEVLSDENGSLSNGDTVLLSIEWAVDDLLYHYGVTLARTELEITVSGLR